MKEAAELVNLLCTLNKNSYEEGHFKFSKQHIDKICLGLEATFDEICSSLHDICDLYFSSTDSLVWKFLLLNLYILRKIGSILNYDESEILSVEQNNNIRSCLEILQNVGVYSRVLPNLPFYKKISGEESMDIYFDYNILKCTLQGLCGLLEDCNLRSHIFQICLKGILVGIYQISYCPLRKPDKTSNPSFTSDVYNKLLKEKADFKQLLNHLSTSIYPTIYIRETMLIFKENSPLWLKKALSQNLTNALLSKNGIENLTQAVLDGDDDTTKNWEAINIITKLILSCKQLDYFEEKIIKQMTFSLNKCRKGTGLVFERIFVQCTKQLYWENEDLCRKTFLDEIFEFPSHFWAASKYQFNDEDTTEKIIQTGRLLHMLFIQKNAECPNIPIKIVNPYVEILFRIYQTVTNTSLTTLSKELKEILIKYISSIKEDYIETFDCFLFGMGSKSILSFRTDIVLHINSNSIVTTSSNHRVISSVSDNSATVLDLLRNNNDQILQLFNYLLLCICNKDKYFTENKDDLLNLECEYINECFNRKIVVFRMLSEIIEDKNIQKQISENPSGIVLYTKTFLEKAISLNVQSMKDHDCDEYQTLFTVIMIIHSLIKNSNSSQFGCLEKLIRELLDNASNEELRKLLMEILYSFRNESKCSSGTENKTELEKAIEDTVDELIPTRGHGLMTLAKLIKKQDSQAVARKHYIFKIFQQNLKNEESYLYLTAINGLAAMADIFPDYVIKILCEEYADFTDKQTEDNWKTQMKLGEVLVKVVKQLGEMTPKYKSLLLNTFLNGTKHDDNLIRASSLSNLAEICQVLGYKLGTVITEILVCVHSIIATDKALEPRRAAVSVIRQLFVGLDKELVVVLKDEILPIYRTLKNIYNNDKDEVMRLQAQLAIEELNEIMKTYVFPKPTLNLNKKHILLD